MENKEIFKKFFLASVAVIIFLTLGFLLVNKYYSFQTQKIMNGKIASILAEVKAEYPAVKDHEIIEILKSERDELNILREFGYDFEKDSFILRLNINNTRMCIVECCLIFCSAGVLILILFLYNRKVGRAVKDLIDLVDKINHKNYELELETYTEDELSVLRSEIYKTTLMLKEVAENSKKDKLKLKDSLADISHQLKTPLTSIMIMLDAIIDDSEMEPSIREKFIIDIKREIQNINFLVQNLLKLSKFDVSAVKFIKEKVSLKMIVGEAIKNVASLCDLKSVNIEVVENSNVDVFVDMKWQVEALTNILKNCVEYSFENGEIRISFEENKMYSSIIIEDHGKGIDKDDLTHIFERFYKGRNSSKDSVGIGLALSKSIVEHDGGRIIVESKVDKGTKFKIKYERINKNL